MKYVFLDELEGSGPVAELVVQLVGEPGLLEHALTLGEARIDMADVLEDVLSDELVPAGPLLNLRLQQVAGLASLQLFRLLVESRRRFQGCNGRSTLI